MSPHSNRPIMNPEPQSSFDQVFNAISSLPNKTISRLLTTGGVTFKAEAKTSSKLGNFIQLPHNNRIYPCCWGNSSNHMGKDGQRIGQYARSLDEWYQNL
ncbi:hypothetical protein ES703_74834 [subsurface metagenome]